MSNDEIKTLDTDVVIFPMKLGNKSAKQIPIESEIKMSETQPQNTAKQKVNMFARLKKSVRKKSISIL